MSKTLKVRELNGPAYVCNASCDLPVDEVTEPADAHNVRTCDGQFIGDRQKWLAPGPAKHPDACSCAKQNTVCRHSAKPNGRYLPRVVPVVRPLIEKDLDDPTTQQYAQRQDDRQTVDGVHIVVVGTADALHPEKGREQPDRVACSIPP